MTIELAIHEQWSGYRPLAALVPPERLYTGLPPIRDAAGKPVTFPYVSIAAEADAKPTRTSSGTLLSSERIRFSIHAKTYDEARRIDRTLCDYFNRRDFASPGGRVLDMKPAGRSDSEDATDGVWRIDRDFLIRHSETRGSTTP